MLFVGNSWIGLSIAFLPWQLARLHPVGWELVLQEKASTSVLLYSSQSCVWNVWHLLPFSVWETTRGNGCSVNSFGGSSEQQLEWRFPMPALKFLLDRLWWRTLLPQMMYLYLNCMNIYAYIHDKYIVCIYAFIIYVALNEHKIIWFIMAFYKHL